MISYGINGNNVPVVLFGTADPDAGVYELNAVTGKEIWRFQTYNPGDGPADVGAGVTVSLPGNNGFADGVAYVPSKNGRLYAIDLTTGAEIWEYAFESFPPVGNGARDTAALDGDNVVFGTTVGTFDVNAVTGKEIWEQPFPTKPNEVLGAPAIAGPPGEQVVYTTNVNGQFQVLSLAKGAVLYTYQTGNYVASSPAVFSNNLLFTAANGFLYDIALGGGNTGSPTTAVTSPAQGSTVANPDTATVAGTLVISGTASDPAGVHAVKVTVQQGGQTGSWWSQVTKSWEGGIVDNGVALVDPGATSTSWTLKVPAPAAGTIMEVRAAAVDTAHLADTSSDESQSSAARVDFTVAPSTSAPTLQLSAARAAPAARLTATGAGYQPGEQVAITLPIPSASSPVTTLTTVTATSSGALPATPIAVPNPIVFGPIAVNAVGQTSGDAGTATLVVSNNWDEWGNTPTKGFFESNDLSATDNVAASGRFYYDQAYNFPTLSPIKSTVAIDNGVAFFGDNAGDFYAINVSTSIPVWEDTSSSNTTTYTPPDRIIDSAGGIDSSAAVDPNLQINGTPEPAVIFGTESDSSGNGSVTAVDEDTGGVLWSRQTSSGVESSPALYDGQVYVATDDGTFYDLNEQTGAVQWQEALTADATTGVPESSPAIDDSTLHPSVVVGDGDDVTAMNLTTGAVLWGAPGTTGGLPGTTGGVVTATPTYFSNNIYVGSQDGSEYAFNGSTGAPLWTYPTGIASGPTPGAGGPILASNVTFGTELAVGSTNGTIYYLSAAVSCSPNPPPCIGLLQNSLVGTAPVVGMSGAVNFAVATMSNGTAIATRITGIDQTWKYYGDGYGIDSAPVVNNGNVYITGLDDNLHVFAVPSKPVY